MLAEQRTTKQATKEQMEELHLSKAGIEMKEQKRLINCNLINL